MDKERGNNQSEREYKFNLTLKDNHSHNLKQEKIQKNTMGKIRIVYCEMKEMGQRKFESNGEKQSFSKSKTVNFVLN